MEEVKAAWPFPTEKQDTYRVQLRRPDGSFGSYVVDADSHQQAHEIVREVEPDAVSMVAMKRAC